MSFEIVTVPCLSDNYAFLIHGGGKTALVDAPEAAPIAAELDRRGWTLDEIWITHHHDDHVMGVAPLVERHGAKVRGSSADRHPLPDLDLPFAPGDIFDFAGEQVQVIDVPGHTIGHIALFMPAANALFSGDSLMALGCGRVFEGTMDQMWNSLSRLSALPGNPMIYSGHEYTASNGRFALTIEPENADLLARVDAVAAARAKDEPTVPADMETERATNPFLRAALSSVKEALDMSGEDDASVFAEIRRRKDAF